MDDGPIGVLSHMLVLHKDDRDPQTLGLDLLNIKERYPQLSLSEVYDDYFKYSDELRGTMS